MAVLVHKRCKASALHGEEPLADDKWWSELESCIRRWTPDLTDIGARARLMRTLDGIVAEEQKLRAEAPAAVPMTSRFDTPWAI